jgi:signal transduction histidine kinase
MTIEIDKLLRLLSVGRSLVTELDTEKVLHRILEEARDATDARYVALGVMNEDRTELERFLTLGIEEPERTTIGDLPRGRGVLGVLIQHPQTLRLADVGSHPQSYGFPSGHPVMETFLGVPVVIRGQVWGNLYLTDKQGGDEFTEADETAARILADFAATAIELARVYERSEERRLALEQAVQGLEAARDIADAIGGANELDRILELVVKRGRALVGARSVLIMLREGDDLVVAASAGHALNARGRRVPVARSTSGQILERGRPERIDNVGVRLRVSADDLGVAEAQTALLVPMLHHGVGLGVLAAFDRGEAREPFTLTDEQLLRTFAASAGNAVAISRSVEADRLRATVAAAEAERARWARELHDQTLQALAGLRVGLSTALRRDDPTGYAAATRQAISDIELEIANLRGIIADLRPSLLDDVGLRAALEALLDRRREDGLKIGCEVELPESLDAGSSEERELETTVYRLVQESLTNVVKHANAAAIDVAVRAADGSLTVEVHDDGHGFNPGESSAGFGLAGMRERVFLLGGQLQIESGKDGTTVRALIPLPAESAGLGADQAVS